MRLALYTRRSKETQVASPETQETLVREYCEQHDHELVRVYHEIAISGKSEEERRTALPELMAAVRDKKRRNFEGIIVWKTDRLYRNQAEWHRMLSILDANNCALISVMDPVNRETASGRLMSNIFADLAAFEREQVGERIYAHHVAALLRGQWPGGRVPTGLEWDSAAKRFRPGSRADDVVQVFYLYCTTGGSTKTIAMKLNESGVPAPEGGLWSPTKVLRILKGPAYRQRLTFDGREVYAPDVIPRIVPQALVDQANMLIEQRRNMAPREVGAVSPYSGLITCSLCGGKMTHCSAGRRTDANGFFRCKAMAEYGICRAVRVSDVYIDALVGAAVGKLAKRLKRIVCRKIEVKPVMIRQRKRNDLKAMKARVLDMYEMQVIDRGEFLDRIQRVEKKIKGLDQIPTRPVSVDIAAIGQAMDRIGKDWSRVPVDEKRLLMLIVGAGITLSTSGESPIWIELHTIVTKPIRAFGIIRGNRWGIRLLK